MGVPIPPSPETSRALIAAFAERGIEFVPGRSVRALDPARRVAVLDDDSERPYDLFFGVPRHRVPDVVAAAFTLGDDGYVPVSPATMETRMPRVYAVGDVTTVGVPKAGVFAEGEARAAAAALIAALRTGRQPAPYDGRGMCYIEFGGGRVGRVDVDFFSAPQPTGRYFAPSTELVAEKHDFGSSRRARWFGAGSRTTAQQQEVTR
jgi:sulfide:quinone oxidoreductase